MEIINEKTSSCSHQLGKVYNENGNDYAYYLCSKVPLEEKDLFVLIDLENGHCVCQYDSIEELDKDNNSDIEVAGSFIVK